MLALPCLAPGIQWAELSEEYQFQGTLGRESVPPADALDVGKEPEGRPTPEVL